MPKPAIFNEGKLNNILAVLEVLLIVCVLLISFASYRVSQTAFERSLREPQFEIGYHVYDTMHDIAYLSDEKTDIQPIVFLSATDQEIESNNYYKSTENSKAVCSSPSGSILSFEFTNIGEVSAKYPTIFFSSMVFH
jgi:hypothetical protein